MATTDEMTQLANRRSFMELAGDWLREAGSKDESLSILLLDMDHLKRINDTHGHAIGDAAIEHVAAALRKRRSERELPARLGGEEFAVALRCASIDDGHVAAEEIRGHLGNSFLPEVGMVTASFGVAAFPADGTTASELLKAADGRLYKAKAGGRNQVCSSSLPETIPPTPGEMAETPAKTAATEAQRHGERRGQRHSECPLVSAWSEESVCSSSFDTRGVISPRWLLRLGIFGGTRSG